MELLWVFWRFPGTMLDGIVFWGNGRKGGYATESTYGPMWADVGRRGPMWEDATRSTYGPCGRIMGQTEQGQAEKSTGHWERSGGEQSRAEQKACGGVRAMHARSAPLGIRDRGRDPWYHVFPQATVRHSPEASLFSSASTPAKIRLIRRQMR
jgi:hypothetical protein